MSNASKICSAHPDKLPHTDQPSEPARKSLGPPRRETERQGGSSLAAARGPHTPAHIILKMKKYDKSNKRCYNTNGYNIGKILESKKMKGEK